MTRVLRRRHHLLLLPKFLLKSFVNTQKPVPSRMAIEQLKLIPMPINHTRKKTIFGDDSFSSLSFFLSLSLPLLLIYFTVAAFFLLFDVYIVLMRKKHQLSTHTHAPTHRKVFFSSFVVHSFFSSSSS